jgi:pimeloyl-ACP methyl ester carboxylesterase
MRRLFVVFALLIAGLAVTGGPAHASSPLPYYSQKLVWKDCHDGFQCATLKVPLDYSKPGGDQIGIAVIRLPASGKHRIGSLVINPGGPGVSGVDFARQAKSTFSAGLLARFDVVGFDPRGVGASSPVRCLTPLQFDAYYSIDDSPDQLAEYKQLDLAQQQYAKGCELNSGKLLAHVGTPDAARDMDVLRAALGERKLTYFGFSYGTFLGTTYAELFPKRVRALVLDGAIDPAKTERESSTRSGQAFDAAFTAFLRDCFTHKDCPFKTHKIESAVKRIQALIKQVDKAPLRNTYDGRQVSQPIVTLGIFSALYATDFWPYLRQGFTEAFKGEGMTLLQLADVYHERNPANGSYTNQAEAFTAINCMDHPRARVPLKHKPRLFTLPCDYWPVQGHGKARAMHAKGAPPIMVVGTTRDPATPYADAQALASELSSGFLVSWDGDGHTAYHKGSSCVDKTVDRYLINLTVPKKDPHC